MKITGGWLSNGSTQAVSAMLRDAGWQAFFVGGCVRNSLIGAPVADIDIATDALPDQVMALGRAAAMRVLPTGVDHGTVTVIADGTAYEVTTFRRDVETDGRRAVVAFSDRIEDDASRRDFTMNALYAQPDGTVIDPLGGLPDLLARRVRFVGDARARIAEDYLRILRYFRFYAWYGDPSEGPDPEGLAACAELAGGIAKLSRERVGAEIRKLMGAPNPVPAVAAMARSGVLAQTLPGADDRTLGPLVHLEDGMSPDWRRRLAAIDGENVGEMLRLSRAETAYLENVRKAVQSGEGAAALAFRFGHDVATDAVLLTAASVGITPPANWQAEIARGAAAKFPVKAADLSPVHQGPALGRLLHDLQERWIASDFSLTKGDLLG